METKSRSTKTVVKKTAVKTKGADSGPFESVAESAPVKKRVAKKVTAKTPIEAAPVVKAARKAKKDIILDPFAEVVTETSPVKKRAVKTEKVVAKREAKVEAQREAKVEAKAAKKPARKAVKKVSLDVTAEIAAEKPEVELSPVFKALAEPVLPALPRENRARLQMQTPTRLYFYWSIRENPWHLLKNVFGDDLGSYSLVLKLIDEKSGYEEIHPTDVEGNYWFDAEPDRSYTAEIGFYAPNRPYFRVLYSNTVTTPRRSPSPHSASEARWTVSATKFAEVLDVAGFTRDAFDVAMAGDDHAASQRVSHTAFASLLDGRDQKLDHISAEDIRYAMLALASGATLEELRFRVSASLFAILQANAGSLGKDRAMSALTEHFDIDESEFSEEQTGPAVYGASLVNFPRTLKTKSLSPKGRSDYSPVSSHSYR